MKFSARDRGEEETRQLRGDGEMGEMEQVPAKEGWQEGVHSLAGGHFCSQMELKGKEEQRTRGPREGAQTACAGDSSRDAQLRVPLSTGG